MAIIATPYGQSFKGLGLGRFDFSSHSFKLLLATSAYTPNFDTDEYRADVTGEVSGVGYTTGGTALASLAWTYDPTNDRCVLTADPVVFSGANFTCRYGIVYRNTGTNATSPLLSWIDFGADVAPANVAFTVTFTDGVYRVRTP